MTIDTGGLVQMDIMGNTEALPATDGKTVLTFAQAGRPVYLFKPHWSGAEFAKLLNRLAKPNVLLAEGVYGLPDDWMAKGQEGNPFIFRGKPVWRVGRVYPPDRSITRVANAPRSTCASTRGLG